MKQQTDADAGSVDGGPDQDPGALESRLGSPCASMGDKGCDEREPRQKLICFDGRWAPNGFCEGETVCESRDVLARGTCVAADAPPCPADACEGGTCVGGGDDYTCDCPAGFTGTGTQACVPDEQCPADACAGGVCVEGVDDYSCECDAGYTGSGTRACTPVDDCPEGACAGGICVDGVDDYSCECAAGFTGSGTQECVNVDDCPVDACAGGSCVDGIEDWTCNCGGGLSGTGTKECVPAGQCPMGACAGGSCVPGEVDYTCTCADGFTGSGTQQCTNIDDCPPGACAGGFCVDGINDYSCTCAPGFAGTGTKQCDNVDDCPVDACANGTCVDGVNDYSCDCDPGFGGTGTKQCDGTDDCPPDACENGTCVDGVDDYTCDCDAGYTGTGTKQCVTSSDPFAGLVDVALKAALRTATEEPHVGLGYTTARNFMYGITGNIDVHDGKLECIYTGRLVDPDGTRTPGGFNTEHSWPRSGGAGSFPAEGDIHHLFTTDATSNSQRSSLDFGVTVCSGAACPYENGGSERGDDASGDEVFEVRAAFRGDVARAHFYFSVRYSLAIPAEEESTLRAWHVEDPVSQREQQRNTDIESVQGNRNPFVDYPELVGRITDF